MVSADDPSALINLGAAEVISRDELNQPAKPLAKERWAGGIDLGRQPHAGQCAVDDILWRRGRCLWPRRRHGSAVERRPFILRGVSLLGVDSVMAPKAVRLEAWRRIGSDLDLQKLASLSTTIGFDGIIDAARDIVDGKIRGRIVVDM